ncbi:MAG TPA: sialidase family protein [Chthoniobacteraceae bacterium]|nr:sialidase family protein [Chthoniobacteraceae bacterium]
MNPNHPMPLERLPCRSVMVEDHFADGQRAGEGSIVALNDGRLLLLYSRFSSGGGDADAAVIASRISRDGGGTWSEAETLFPPPPGALNAMSVSLLRLRDGRIGCLYLHKWNRDHVVPVFRTSADEGASWSAPVEIAGGAECFVVNNDRLIELRDGTLAAPYARWNREADTCLEERGNMFCGLFYSRDGGDTWQRSPHEIRHAPGLFTPPLFVDPSGLEAVLKEQLDRKYNIFQEPGIVEVEGGGLMMWVRTAWTIYRCFARGVASPWEDCGPMEGFNVCCGPQTIRREPDSGLLVMFYNDRGEIPWGLAPAFSHRTPLSVAISRDEGRTWQRRGHLEDDRRNYCYFSLLFLKDRFITSYYESGILPDQPEARGRRRNLASLKVAVGDSRRLLGLTAAITA